MSTGEVVSSILLAADELLRVEELAVGAGADLVNDRRLQVHEDAAGHVLASARLGEEGVERVITATNLKMYCFGSSSFILSIIKVVKYPLHVF